jgi:hypothetical protein
MLGTAIKAKMPTIATTIISSIRVNALVFLIEVLLSK